jgi:alanyl-tRNA synthetase
MEREYGSARSLVKARLCGYSIRVSEKLYHRDPYLFEFDATVVSSTERDGSREVVLDGTAFYPGGGGQPCDRGTLAGAPVVEVKYSGDEIVHVVDAHLVGAPLDLLPGSRVHGAVDVERRLDFMAQHTGQHILSQALLAVGGLATVSVHFGEETTTIEVAQASVDGLILAKAEDLANAVVRENRTVRVHEVDPSEASRFPLRRTPPDAGRLRIVEVDSFDWAACGGVHVATAGEVGIVKIVSQEKIRGHARIHVIMGRRALADYGRRIALLQELSRQLTCGEGEMAARVGELVAGDREKTRELRRLRLEQATAAADSALAAAEHVGPRGSEHPVAGALLVRRVFDGAGADYLKAFAERIVAAPGRIVIAVDRAADSFQWIVSHSIDAGPDLSAIVKPLLPLADARGGGRGGRVQGSGGNVAAVERFMQAIADAITE